MAAMSGYKQSAEHIAKRIASRLETLAAKPKTVSRDWLFAHYSLLGLDMVQIGGMLQKDPKTIWSWMRHYGIETRPRGGHTSPNAFRPGEPNLFAGRRHTPETRARLSAHAKATGRVPYDPAVGSYMKGRSGADTPNWKGGITPERQAFYLTDEWRDAVKAVWSRSDAACERCGKRHNTIESRGTFHVHHIVSFMVRELRAIPSNLVLLCKPCHLFVHSGRNTEKQFIKDAENGNP